MYIYNFDINHYANTDDLGLAAMQSFFGNPWLRFAPKTVLRSARRQKTGAASVISTSHSSPVSAISAKKSGAVFG